MTAAPISLLAATFLGLVYFLLTANVIKHRMKLGVSLGDGGNPTLLKAIRAHGNFAEYVPFALILLYLVEISGASNLVVMIAASLLVAGRLLHFLGITQAKEVNVSRKLGTIFTWLSLILLTLLGLIQSFL